MKESVIYGKWKQQDGQFNYLNQQIQRMHRHLIENLNQLVLSTNTLKAIMTQKEIMSEEEFEVAIKSELDKQEEFIKKQQEENATPQEQIQSPVG